MRTNPTERYDSGHVNADPAASTDIIEASCAYIERLGRAEITIEQGLQAPKGSSYASGSVRGHRALDGQTLMRNAAARRKSPSRGYCRPTRSSEMNALSRAPAEVVEKERAKLAQAQASKDSAEQALARLS